MDIWEMYLAWPAVETLGYATAPTKGEAEALARPWLPPPPPGHLAREVPRSRAHLITVTPDSQITPDLPQEPLTLAALADAVPGPCLLWWRP